MTLADDLADIDATIAYWKSHQGDIHHLMAAITTELHCTYGWKPVRRAMIEYLIEHEIGHDPSYKRAA
jgi:hypothetical protein